MHPDLLIRFPDMVALLPQIHRPLGILAILSAVTHRLRAGSVMWSVLFKPATDGNGGFVQQKHLSRRYQRLPGSVDIRYQIVLVGLEVESLLSGTRPGISIEHVDELQQDCLRSKLVCANRDAIVVMVACLSHRCVVTSPWDLRS